MWTLLKLFKPADADCTGVKAAPAAERELGEEELDHVAGGGGKVGASTNPVED